MKRLYAMLPGDPASVARPVIDIVVEGMVEAELRCIVDSGSVHTLMPAWVAAEAGVALAGADELHLLLGGTAVIARFAAVQLTIGDHRWEAPVGFCDPWPYGWGLLGQASFFRFFVVTFRAADWELEIEPVER
ncbi:MAG: retropepsin-like aspartic protease [Acidimicrobiia bacterium]